VHATQTIEDLGRATRNMIVGAIAVTTGRLNLERPDDAMARVEVGDSTAIEYFRYELAHQVGILLVRSDENVIAVYKEHEIPEAEELGSPDTELSDPIDLVVYSERETAALRSLINAIDQSLAEALSERCGKVLSGVISAAIITPHQAKRTFSLANSLRPRPALLISRED
jgi:hypothetical protein